MFSLNGLKEKFCFLEEKAIRIEDECDYRCIFYGACFDIKDTKKQLEEVGEEYFGKEFNGDNVQMVFEEEELEEEDFAVIQVSQKKQKRKKKQHEEINIDEIDLLL